MQYFVDSNQTLVPKHPRLRMSERSTYSQFLVQSNGSDKITKP